MAGSRSKERTVIENGEHNHAPVPFLSAAKGLRVAAGAVLRILVSVLDTSRQRVLRFI